MKSVKLLVLALVSLVVTAQAFAGTVWLSVGETRNLPSCGGQVKVNNGGNDKQLNLVFSKVKNCSNVIIGSKEYKIKGDQGKRNGSYTLVTADELRRGSYTAEASIESNSRVHADTIKVKFSVR